MSTGPSLYRRHRPRTFADVVGQEQVVRTLSNAVSRGKVHHAYLFVGSRGTGKTSMAKILAACLNCEQGPTVEPCGRCDSCVSIARATSLDVIEMDAASNNSVDDIRDLREKVAYAPVSGRHKVYILDEAHMLSPQAWNAFLKTLEEPPPRTIFVLATTEAQKVLPTVVDRCHRFDFGRPSVEQVGKVLSRVAAHESIQIEPGALALVARHATGSFRDALGTLEQLLTYAGDQAITSADVMVVLGIADAEQLFEAVDAVVARDPAGALRAAARLSESGRDPGQVLRDLEVHGRELLAVQILGEVPVEVRVTPERDARLLVQAQAMSGTDVVRLLDLVSAALEATANGAQSRIQLELVLIKAADPQVDPSTTALLARIERLEAALHGAAAAGKAPASRAPAAATQPPVAATQPPVAATQPPAAATQPPAPGPPRTHTTANGAGDHTSHETPGSSVEAQSAGKLVEAEPEPQPQQVEAEVESEPELVPAALELGTIVDSWPAVIDVVGKENAMLAALLADARPVSLADQSVTIAFPIGAAFLKKKAEQDDHRRAAAEAFRSVTGQALRLRYELSDEDPAQAQPDAPLLSGEDLVRRFVEEFDAEELESEPEPPDDPQPAG